MPGRLPTRLGRLPGDTAALVEFDHVVLPNVALCGRHREDLAYRADTLACGGLGQVVVAVPAWLLTRISDELEDRLRPRRDLAAGPDHARNLGVSGHGFIQAPPG